MSVSVPDKLFYQVRNLAVQKGIFRSEVFRLALEHENSKETLLENLNRVYSEVDSSLDPVMSAYVKKRLLENEWE